MTRESEPILIREYDPAWPSQFKRLSERALDALGKIVRRIEHIGSTAVPNLAAKPIIDMDVVLGSDAELPEAICRLATISYLHEGNLGINGREAFRSPQDEVPHHLYVLVEGAEELRRHIAFRDALRADGLLRGDYARLKRLLADRYAGNRQSYSEAKSDFIKAVIDRATVSERPPSSSAPRFAVSSSKSPRRYTT